MDGLLERFETHAKFGFQYIYVVAFVRLIVSFWTISALLRFSNFLAVVILIMFASAGRNRYFDPTVLFQFNQIEKPVQIHLKNVYSLLSIGLLVAAVGAYLFTFSEVVRSWAVACMFSSMIVSIVTVSYIFFTENTAENLTNRVLAFLAFTFSSGVGLGPLVHFAAMFNPSSLPTAFLGTALIFVSFTIASLKTKNRYYLYLGGILGTAISVLSTFGLMNIFIRSQAIFQAELYVGFLIFCLFVVYDTQLIVRKRQMGDTDFVKHSVDLFTDVIAIFRHLLIILNSKRERNERRE